MTYKDRSKMHAAQKRYAEKGRAYINEVKMSIGQCQECGLKCDPKMLYKFHFDHIDPQTKTGRVGSMICRKIEVIKAEIDKCQLLCQPCHHARTKKERHWLTRRDQQFNPAENLLTLFDDNGS